MEEYALIYYIVCGILSIIILFGISLMSKVKTAVLGNRISAIATAAAIVITLVYNEIISQTFALIVCLVTLLIGSLIGLYLTKKVKMIQMPEMVALLNGLGGFASALVGALTMLVVKDNSFELITAVLAVMIGALTFTGSLIAALKLAKLMNGRPVVWKRHQLITSSSIVLMLVILVLTIINQSLALNIPILVIVILALAISSFFGVAFAIRVGGADMPITISLLNSLSGVAGSIAGMAINDILLVAVGGIVGASGLLLTQIMCRAMNRSLMDILMGKTSISTKVTKVVTEPVKVEEKQEQISPVEVLKGAKKVIIVPGYGMALAQAQQQVKQLSDILEKNGTEVKFAIHPVAGRMPGHMNVLLCEVDIPYEKLYELNDINDEFKDCDACIVIGANDVMNPAAREAEGTPIYGMPILNVDQAKHIIICNYDLKPGYAGVENPIYKRNSGVSLLLGNAKDTLQNLLTDFNTTKKVENKESQYVESLKSAKKVIIVPGYGMALAQAQQQVKQLSDSLEKNGTEVKFAIHPVAGRMPGHMNVLLCEVDIPYEKLYELNDINDEFKDCDACIVIGANDVMNPAAREALGTPIYGMPILNVDQAKQIIICNYDLKPGYAGVENPLYKRTSGVTLLLGNAKDTLQGLVSELNTTKKVEAKEESKHVEILKSAKKVMIVPGYGMALAQAQQLVKQVSDHLEKNGTEVKFAIHPVAGRMPGHMNVLLCEVDIPYEKLYELNDINDEFKDCDACIVIGANDVMNPAARDALGTPIYGMPILNVDQTKHIIICNYDLKPGYAGVENPIYKRSEGVTLLLGNAQDTLQQLLSDLQTIKETKKEQETNLNILKSAKNVIIVPGYGMALAQAQHLVKQISDRLRNNGVNVKFAIHPVAGRMPGHMNVLLCEAGIEYEDLYEMNEINDAFKDCDVCIVIGANDVLNPAARNAEGTPIYGMPILNVDQAKHIIICNYDLKPGYAGVENPLYKRSNGVTLLLGNAQDTLNVLLKDI